MPRGRGPGHARPQRRAAGAAPGGAASSTAWSRNWSRTTARTARRPSSPWPAAPTRWSCAARSADIAAQVRAAGVMRTAVIIVGRDAGRRRVPRQPPRTRLPTAAARPADGRTPRLRRARGLTAWRPRGVAAPGPGGARRRTGSVSASPARSRSVPVAHRVRPGQRPRGPRPCPRGRCRRRRPDRGAAQHASACVAGGRRRPGRRAARPAAWHSWSASRPVLASATPSTRSASAPAAPGEAGEEGLVDLGARGVQVEVAGGELGELGEAAARWSAGRPGGGAGT